MERDTHYLIVGLFVLLTLVGGFFFVGLFYDKPVLNTQRYAIHFGHSVDGLMRGSEVRYMGLKVGEVAAIALPSAGGHYVEVQIKVDSNTPVDTATVASLRQQGLTGVPFVNLTQDSQRKSQPLSPSTDALTVIPSQLSDMDALMQRLPLLSTKLDSLLDAANQALNAENRENLSGLLANLRETSDGLPDLVGSLQSTSRAIGTLTQHLDGVLGRNEKGLNATVQQVQTTLSALQQTAKSIDTLAQNLDQVVVDNEGSIQSLLAESRTMAASLRELGDSLKQNPSQIIYQPAPQGTELPP